MSTITVFHGSDHIVKKPQYLGGREDNDYGNGFYTTEYEDRARSWAALNGDPKSSIVNRYELTLDSLKILNLNECGVLAWIAEVIFHRGAAQEPAALMGTRLMEKYKVNTDTVDVILGYRADDSYMQVIEAFLLNQINVAEIERLFYKGDLGNQVFLKSEKAFEQILWKSSYEAQPQETDHNPDIYARREVNRFLQNRMEAILLEGYEVPGITARYAIGHMLDYQKEGNCYEQTSL